MGELIIHNIVIIIAVGCVVVLISVEESRFMIDLVTFLATVAATELVQDGWVDHEVKIADLTITCITDLVLTYLCSC